VTAGDFEAITPALSDHATEVMSAHGGQPSIEVQDRSHGAGLPAPDHGQDDRGKLAGGQ
jgi:hypothetical protein